MKLFNKFKKTSFCPIFIYFLSFRGKKYFSRKSGCATHFIQVSSTMSKFLKKLMINTQANRRMDRWMVGRMDRPFLREPFQLLLDWRSLKCRPYKMLKYIKSYVQILAVNLDRKNIMLNNPMTLRNTKKFCVLDLAHFSMPLFVHITVYHGHTLEIAFSQHDLLTVCFLK